MLGSGPALRMSLPRDKSELLELRRQLVMELVWLRQAIASRQSVSHNGGGGLGHLGLVDMTCPFRVW